MFKFWLNSGWWFYFSLIVVMYSFIMFEQEIVDFVQWIGSMYYSRQSDFRLLTIPEARL